MGKWLDKLKEIYGGEVNEDRDLKTVFAADLLETLLDLNIGPLSTKQANFRGKVRAELFFRLRQYDKHVYEAVKQLTETKEEMK